MILIFISGFRFCQFSSCNRLLSKTMCPTPFNPNNRMTVRMVGICCLVTWTFGPWQTALAQQGEETEPGTDESKELHPPELENFVEAEYPKRALEERVEGTVILTLTIDANGEVDEAKVEEGLGHGLDEAARAAAEQFEFRPARRGRRAVPSRIRYHYRFQLPERRRAKSPSATKSQEESPSNAPTESKAGRIAGSVRLPDGSDPAVGAEVRVVGPGNREHVVRTDEQGRFRTEPLAPGRYEVNAVGSGGARESLETEVLPGKTTDIAVQLSNDGESEPIEVTVHGESTERRLERSARAVEVIDTERASEKADDMGEVVADEKGVNVRRTGGLGSGSRVSLNGLNDNQIRFFYDGIPLGYAGFPFGLANVPVNLIDHIEIYKGVVPVEYGADALGGAVDLVPEARPSESTIGASYQVGSFDTHRLTVHGQTAGPDSKWYARSHGYFDYAENDYAVDVEVADRTGETYNVTARRFHDEYRAAGGGLEVGTVDRTWTDALSARLFASDFTRDLQHNLIMTVPYGEARYGESVGGGIVRYEYGLSPSFRVDLGGGYNFTRTWFEDVSICNYDWFGRCTSERSRGGEVGKFPTDRRIWEHASFGRFNTAWNPYDHRELRFSVAPTWVRRTGDERADSPRADRDPLEAERHLFDLVSGVEYEMNLLEERLQNIAFFKDYIQLARSDETLPSGETVNHDRTSHRLGAGDSLRYRFTRWFHSKLSYEWATRLPSAEELFGNGVLIQPNPGLEPERSHNANLEFAIDELGEATGTWRANITGFLRRTNHLIVLIGGARSFSYQNVLKARSRGIEAAVGWTSPVDHVSIDLNATYVDLRNVARRGTFEEFYGDRIPNRPYLYGNGRVRLRETDLVVDDDSLTTAWESRYVHNYFRGWASLGRREFKQVIPSQWRQSVALTYGVEGAGRSLSVTLEGQNLTDAKVFDFYGVQKPGRAFYLKSTLEF